jgi:hypothetical protein
MSQEVRGDSRKPTDPILGRMSADVQRAKYLSVRSCSLLHNLPSTAPGRLSRGCEAGSPRGKINACLSIEGAPRARGSR